MKYRLAKQNDISEIRRLTKSVFDNFVGVEYTEEGRNEFYQYLDEDKFKDRLENNHFIIIVEDKGRLVGMIEIREYNHVSLFFVDSNYQGKGIGKELFNRALNKIKENIDRDFIDVNSSKIAIPVYEKLGFKISDSTKESNGIIYTPMRYNLKTINS